MSKYWPDGDLGDDCDGDLDGYDGGYGSPPPLEDDRVAMMLGLVPDKRTPNEKLYDAIRTCGESLNVPSFGGDPNDVIDVCKWLVDSGQVTRPDFGDRPDD